MNRQALSPFWFIPGAMIILCVSAGWPQEDTRFQRIRDALYTFTFSYPQLKAYLHTDRTDYYAGDDMWVKAYLVNGSGLVPDTLATNLYVELIGPSETRVEIKCFQMADGFGTGDFTLSDTLPEGLYQIRAYTSWMQNFDASFFFSRNFQLFNPGYRNIISPRQARINMRELEDQEKMAGDYDVQFMPEGGYLVSGLESVVGFKAINKLGKGVDVTGEIYDDKGNRIVSFSSYYKGIGNFRLKPEKDRKYTATLRIGAHMLKKALPEALETGLVMHAENYSDRVVLKFVSNRPVTSDPTANELIIAGQSGGILQYYKIIRLNDGSADLEIFKAGIPGGILQLTAFSGRGEPLTERLVFVNRQSLMKIRFSASDTITGDGSRILLDIQTRDERNVPLAANLSLSITRDMPGQSNPYPDNIVSSLLLSTDLKGQVEDPLRYFTSADSFMTRALDNLMLTQGWRRFEWKHILAGEYPEIKYPEEQGLTVYGKVTRDFFNIPFRNCMVQLSIMDAYNDVFTRYTDNKGVFIFNNLIYYDTVHVKVEARKTSGRRHGVIVLPEEKLSPVEGLQGDYSLTTLSERDPGARRMAAYAESQEMAKKEPEETTEKKDNQFTSMHGKPDYTLYGEDITMGSRNVLDAMKGRIPGLNVTGNQVSIRGPGSILGGSEPFYLLDGMPVSDVDAILAIPVTEIDRIEVLKGPSASIYGVRGANGVIAVYTKRGYYIIKGILAFDILGYTRPRKFYQPKYEAGEEPDRVYTLHWEPVIVTNGAGKARIIMEKPHIQGDYRFDIQGLSHQGHAGFVTAVISND